MNEISTKTLSASFEISEKTGVSQALVKVILDEYIQCIIKCLRSELPFTIKGLGKFYYIYHTNRPKSSARYIEFYKNKVMRRVKFSISEGIKTKLEGWVHDVGIKNNTDKNELMRLAVRPDEIQKVRRAKVLEDQRKMGFRSELLFDEEDLPRQDKERAKMFDTAPTVEEMLQRMGANIDFIK